MKPLYNTLEWHRCGRGSTFRCKVSIDTLASILSNRLPKELSPFHIYSISPKHAVTCDSRPFVEEPIERFCDLANDGFWFFFVRSLVLTPQLSLDSASDVSATLSFNGLINIQYQHFCQNIMDDTIVGLVHKIQHISGGECREYPKYLQVFQHLKREIRRSSDLRASGHG